MQIYKLSLRRKITTFASDYGYVNIILGCDIIEDYSELKVEMLIEGIELGGTIECDDCGMASPFY